MMMARSKVGAAAALSESERVNTPFGSVIIIVPTGLLGLDPAQRREKLSWWDPQPHLQAHMTISPATCNNKTIESLIAGEVDLGMH